MKISDYLGLAAIDPNEIQRAASILFAPGDTHELRGLPSGRSRIVRAGDPEILLAGVRDLADDRNVYYTLNPISPAVVDRSARKADVLARRWLLIDNDPIKPAEHADDSATDAEHMEALQVGRDIAEHLSGLDWPEPVTIDSGNGCHLLYRIDLPNDDLSRVTIRDALKGLKTTFPAVDSKVHDAPRIAKLPGTMARKGADTIQRPHRPCVILSVPAEIVVVPFERIRALAPAPEPKAKTKTKSKPVDPRIRMKRPSQRRHAAYIEAAILAELNNIASAQPGDRNDTLNVAAFSLGQLVHLGLDRPATERRLTDAAHRAGLGEGETAATIKSGFDAGEKEPRKEPEDRASTNGTAHEPKAEPPPIGKRVIWASSITPKKVEWLWPRRIPLGKMTTFAGQGGLGKTFVLCDIAARVSTGTEWPFCGGECPEPGRVLFISGEDDEDDTLVPRLIECGADLRKIAFLSPESHDNFSLAALELLTAVLDEMTGVRFVVIDPPSSYLGGVDDHKNAELRGLLTPLKHWSSKQRVSIVFNNHVNKAIGANVEAASRVMGSVAWVNAVRAAHMFIKDPDDRERVIFAPIKMNNAAKPKGLSYRITGLNDDRAKVEWLAELDVTADEVLTGGRKKGRGLVATEWLAERFRERREWMSDELKRDAAEAGISKNALWSPEVNALPIVKRKITDATGEAHWLWVALEGWPPDLAEANGCHV